jgi:hypothetical protein
LCYSCRQVKRLAFFLIIVALFPASIQAISPPKPFKIKPLAQFANFSHIHSSKERKSKKDCRFSNAVLGDQTLLDTLPPFFYNAPEKEWYLNVTGNAGPWFVPYVKKGALT